MDENLRIYNSGEIVAWYGRLAEITPAEKKIFDAFKDLFSSRLLDIGIGGGRTTSFLLDKCADYTGIDYSSAFIHTCRKKFPGARILEMDARNLSAFSDNSFEIANFSFNGIDYVNEEGRTKILREAFRVLKPGGTFFFSTHNKDHSTFNGKPWLNPKNSAMVNIKTFFRLAPFLLRKIRNRKKEYYSPDYAIINDYAHQYSLMTFYTTPDFLRRQLKATGFDKISLFSTQGFAVPDPELDDWIFVTALKPA
jgi:ubiquinone/menaquinone biosynthesis C-methylase UbiE